MFMGICTGKGCLKCQRVLVSVTSVFWDKGICRNYGFIFQTFIKQYINLLSFLLFWRVSGFKSARMPVMLPSSNV